MRRNDMRTFIGRSRSWRRRGHLCIASFLFGAVLLITGCSTETTPSKPTASGLKPINQAALQSLVDKTIKEFHIPGAVVLLRTPQGDFTAASGTTQLNTTNPPRANTHFRIASNTKTMTAAVIMLLAQRRKLELNDPVSKYVPGVPNGDTSTIAQLLEMRSGLYNYTNDPKISATIDKNLAKVWTPDELLAIAFAHPTRPVTPTPEPYSHGYLYGSSSVALVGEPPYSPKVQAAARAGTLLSKDYTEVNHSFAQAAGGVISTADDSATWTKALVAGRVLNPAYQR